MKPVKVVEIALIFEGSATSVSCHDGTLGIYSANCACSCPKLSLQRNVQIAYATHFLLDLLPFFADFDLVSLHTLVHLVKRMSLLVKITVLLGQDLLVFVEESPKLVKFTVLEHLEAIESRRDLVRWRYFGHLRDRLIQQMMLAFDKGIVVPEHMFELLDAGVAGGSYIVFVVE